jgi:hypothetical protein
MLNKEKAIDNIIMYFKWEKVHTAMVALNWTWHDSGGEVPTTEMLFRCAVDLLHDAYNRAEKEKCDCSSRTGGFHARAIVDDETKEIIELRLTFEVCNLGYYD